MRLAASLKKRLARLDPRPRVCRRLGALWLLDPTDWLDLRLIARVEFETAQLARFQDLVARFRPTRFWIAGRTSGSTACFWAEPTPTWRLTRSSRSTPHAGSSSPIWGSMVSSPG